jgi:hypothetical protein
MTKAEAELRATIRRKAAHDAGYAIASALMELKKTTRDMRDTVNHGFKAISDQLVPLRELTRQRMQLSRLSRRR